RRGGAPAAGGRGRGGGRPDRGGSCPPDGIHRTGPGGTAVPYAARPGAVRLTDDPLRAGEGKFCLECAVSIAFDSATQTWLLSTPATSYVLRLVDGVPRHAYWGPPLTLEQAAAVPLPVPLTMTNFEGGVYDVEELPVDGGARF